MTSIEFIQHQLAVPARSITATLQLFQEDCTIPFIARYRKDQTGNLDEIQLEQIAKCQKKYDEILQRKATVLKAIQEQGQLTDTLRQSIESCFDLQELEDLYFPYKKKRKTRADIARELGLEPLAKILMAQTVTDWENRVTQYLHQEIDSPEKALQGARDIMAAWMSENLYVRKTLRRMFQRQARITAQVIKDQEQVEAAQKYAPYFDWQESLSRIAAHRLLALLRAKNEGFIRINVEIDESDAYAFLEKQFIKNTSTTADQLRMAIRDCYKRLLAPSLASECLQEAKAKADRQSIGVFSANLNQLLLAPPLGEKRILAIDPGYKTGCKVVCLDEQGNLLYNETIFPHPPQKETPMAMKKIKSMVNAYQIDAIAIGNGTASRETEAFIKKIAFDRPLQVFVVSEAGASVYSASALARQEFPNYDVTVRGAVSIGRRLSDPLAELVKIDPKSIGVGQYQHDVDQNLLKEELDHTVIRCVNSVGININTASQSLLSYVSGIGEKLAANIVQYRSENGPFTNRQQLKKVPRLGEKAFQQAAAFIRIKEGENPLDNSAVHPEAYPIVEQIAQDLGTDVQQLIGNHSLISQVNPEKYLSGEMGILSLQDILKELKKPGLDPRKAAQVFEFDPNIKSIKDLKLGMVLPGIVSNITAFGCFVDIGIKENGLVHISQLQAAYVADVNEVVKLHQHVQVKVLDIDEARKRIQLTMIL